ncbi:disintegrin and metalloproteinase domain-containing protein 12 [Macrosteles quadrilineatus]|uniref:disintegrin and metalloproteinase domain-containing protein 12 n=1 Tax=Macrosteles quadrilineatus TaxID=74068 RepID=UPI0023E2AB82|nr:disintegrin and metalloproteinase domain-containing protein 12 [Macrosteles quadrilineatus]
MTNRWIIVLCFTFRMLEVLTESVLVHNNKGTPAAEFSRVSTVRPRLIHYREKRHISTTRTDKNGVEHLHDVTVALDMNGRDQLLDLRLNRELIPKGYFEKHQKDGLYVVRRPNHQEVELCHYQGRLRGVPDSWAAVSTCQGLRGVVYDGDQLHYLERATDSPDVHDTDHYLYSHINLVANHTCGYQGTDHSHINDFHHLNRIGKRFKRSEEVIRGPYNANARSSYVELVLVMDNKEYKALGENMDKVNNHCKDIANIINALYVPLNIFIALVGVVVWTEYDEIALSANGDTTLTNFLHYRREKLVKEHPNDNAQLLTRIQFEGGVVGKALKGPICTFEFSGGVSMDHSAVVGLVATTVAHEMGHNFGMEHDSSDCQCPDDRCIMAPSSSSMSPTHWSSCSLEYLALAFEHGMDYCLRNKPTKLFDSPVCGNGFVEAGEQCDCGLKDHCDNPCCNPNTCMLFSNASCATGECCDLKTCRPKTIGTLCREADQECDLAEYCTGQSEYCPEDVFKMDGIKCNKGKAYCYKGSCRTHSDQCKLLWGPSGKSSDTQCYKMNKKGSRHGNCGYNRLNQSYIKCQEQDLQCGMLHCTHLNERLEFGMESVAILSHSFINSQGSIIPCRTALVDLGLNEVDPGLAPDGARCGEGKMCVNQKCMEVKDMLASGSVAQCPNNCNNNGVCNSRGHCHCNMGFAPPNCDYPGPGGSQDSGPASDPNARREFIIFLYVTFLGIVPFIAVVSLFVYYMKRNPTFWRKKPRIAIIDKKMASPGGRTLPRGSVPMVPDTSRASLLPSADNSSTNPANFDSNLLQNNLVGQYKGFSITPLPKTTANVTPTRQAPAVAPAHKVSPPKVPDNVVSQHIIPYPVRPAPKVPPTSVGLTIDSENLSKHQLPPDNPPPPRPNISSPVLDATTSFAAKELISNTVVPLRPAPPTPNHDKPRTARPLSSPVHDVTLEAKIVKPKDSGYPTLTRIASFMSRNQKGAQEIKKDLPVKGAKIDKESLKNIEISNPILQKEIAVPASSLPAGEKAVVMRAQSLRTVPDKKPAIASFGSMRVPANKRPTSIPAANRPSSPPPPRPPSFGIPGYQNPSKMDTYDDCLNLLTEGVAPLANIDEESPSATDNIYAVIEESPTDRRERKEIVLPRKLEYTSPTGEYKSPKPMENSVSAGSAESMGLLGEIVSEIQARNTESIYSTSTLNRKKEKDGDETASTVTDSSSEIDKNQTYVNTPWNGGYTNITTPPKSSASSTTSSSGYLSPINHNISNKTSAFGNSESFEVPESKAPYKPYIRRNLGPLASASLAGKTIPRQTDSTRSTAVTEDKNSSIKTSPFVKKNSLNNSINNRSSNSRTVVRTNSDGLSSMKPDIVSSCSPSGVKSPDVIGNKAQSTSLAGFTSKPTPGKSGSSFRGRQPLPAPKPVIPTTKASITSQPLPAIPTVQKTKPTESRAFGSKSDANDNETNKSVPANKQSSVVASLQQKFETNKQPRSQSMLKNSVAKNSLNNFKTNNVRR